MSLQPIFDFGVRSIPPCGDCDADGHCTMNCGPSVPRRRLTVLNEAGDTTISWTEDRDDEMEAIIQKKMDQGVTFFIVERGRGKTLMQRGPRLENSTDARKARALVIPDEDLAKFVASGAGTVERASDAPIKTSRVSRSAKEVARSADVAAAKPRRGG